MPENIKSRKQTARRAYLKTRDKRLAYGKAYREKNKEKFVAWQRKWREENRERYREIQRASQARRRAGLQGVSREDLNEWADSQAKVCYWCESKCRSDFHIDHYVPLAKGGQHEIDNLVIACPKCNLAKHAKDPYEFAESMGRLF
ncbi:HNH endonuclease [Marinobacter sp. OP 3.4]|uniref:HNH endonuclease n=1 Tax=Marinobacter sp. OP 3.4 TaxID=3076501 RepID=UPI002E232BB3